MNTTNTRHVLRRNAMACAVALATAFAAHAAAAQDATSQNSGGAPQTDTKELDRIEVTGSRVLRTDSESPAPVQVISSEQIERTGKTNVGDFLQTLTANGSGAVPKSFSAGFASGSSGVSLRGLGAGNTLVLLNGRRIAPYGMADDGQKVFTDLSVIPTDAIERVEVLKDGASSIYGSDAIAGVVNIILRSDYQGAMAKASYGVSDEGGGAERKGSFTWGAGDLAEQGVNFFFSVEASKSDSISLRDRKGRKWIGGGDVSRWGYDPHDYGSIAGYIFPPTDAGAGSAQNSPIGAINNAPGLWSPLGTPEQCAQVDRGTDMVDPNGGCLWDSAKFGYLQPEQKYITFFSRATFAISDTSELYTEFGYSKKNTISHGNPRGVSGSWGSPGVGAVNASSGPGATVIGANHPDNPYGVTGRIRYSAFDLGPSGQEIDNQFYRFLVGMKGTMGEWDYDVGYLHSATQLDQTRDGFLRYSRVREVLANGDTSPVGWWRLGANSGLNSQALYDYISPTISSTAQTSLDVLDVNFSRSLADLRGGAMGLAVGGEWRKVRAELTPTTFTDEGDIIGLGYSAYNGEETVTSAFAELVAPVLESLELTGAVRMDSYRDGETSWTPKAGFKWKPADWFVLRGTYAEGFRAPNAAETAGSSVGFANVTDPTRCNIDTDPSTPEVDSATGCPTGVAFINRPNPDLEPEKAKTYSFGVVLQPTANTSLTLDAWKIKRTNEIVTQSYAQALAAGNVIRNDDPINGVPDSGTPLAVYTDYINASSTTVEGIDFDGQQVFPLGDAGRLTLDLQVSHVRKYEIDADGTKFDIAGTHDNCNVTNCIGTPRNRINMGLTWDVGQWSISSVANYRGAFKNTVPYSSGEGCGAHFADGSDAPNNCRIPSFYSVDLSGSWNPTEAFQIFGSVQNVTDRIAPIDMTTYGAINYNPMDFAGAVGRYYTLGVKYTFQ